MLKYAFNITTSIVERVIMCHFVVFLVEVSVNA